MLHRVFITSVASLAIAARLLAQDSAPLQPAQPLPSPTNSALPAPSIVDPSAALKPGQKLVNRRTLGGYFCQFPLIEQHGTVEYWLADCHYVADIEEVRTDGSYRYWNQVNGTGSSEVVQWATAIHPYNGCFAIWLKTKADGKWRLFDAAERVAAK